LRVTSLFAAAFLAASAAVAAAAPLALDVVNATVTDVVDETGRVQPAGLTITLSQESAAAFGAFTAANIGKTVELRMNGKPVLTAVVREAITNGRVRIGGNFTRAELMAIANAVPISGIQMEAEVVSP
jgi:preprotein translocase subunit SecD